MDHIVALPESNGSDAILVVVCRLTKQAIFIACNTTDTSATLAKHFIRHVFSKHGIPADIISDRGSTFVSVFWQSLCENLGIKSNLSTAYHPETDGQTERTNQTLEQYLRLFVNYDQNDWEEMLPLAEFVYNNSPNRATGVSPFFANKGYNPRLSISLDKVPNHAAHLVAEDLNKLHEHLKDQIRKANLESEQHANKRREKTPNWVPGQKVWLSTENIRTKRRMRKLDWKRLGPFEISEKISSHAYRLKLPQYLKGIHNVFHVSLLQLDVPDEFPNRKPSPPPPVEIEGDNIYVVEQILNSRRRGKGIQFLVRWQGYGPEDDTWETLSNLPGALQRVQEFQLNHPNKPHATKAAMDRLEQYSQEGIWKTDHIEE